MVDTHVQPISDRLTWHPSDRTLVASLGSQICRLVGDNWMSSITHGSFNHKLTAAGSFAECILSSTRQRRLCRVFFSALGKDGFAECFFSALGKDVFCRVPFFGTRQNASLPSAFFRCSAKRHFAVCIFFLPSANHFLKAIFEALNEFK